MTKKDRPISVKIIISLRYSYTRRKIQLRPSVTQVRDGFWPGHSAGPGRAPAALNLWEIHFSRDLKDLLVHSPPLHPLPSSAHPASPTTISWSKLCRSLPALSLSQGCPKPPSGFFVLYARRKVRNFRNVPALTWQTIQFPRCIDYAGSNRIWHIEVARSWRSKVERDVYILKDFWLLTALTRVSYICH